MIALLALLPWCAVALVGWSKGLLRFDTLPNDGRLDIFTLLMVPSFVLGLRAVVDIDLLYRWQALAPGFLAGLPLVAAVLLVHQRIDTPRRWGLLVQLFTLVGLPYGASVLCFADELLDHAAPQVFSTEVIDKYIASGKSPHPTLMLAPWGPKSGNNIFIVGDDVYAQTAIHSTVCPALHHGSVGLPWYRLEACKSPTRVLPMGSP